MKNYEFMELLEFAKLFIRSIDGVVLLVICFISLLLCIDVFVGESYAPLRDANNPSKAIILLVFSPILSFLLMLRLRQLPFSDSFLVHSIRVVLPIALFIVINFY